MAFNKFEQIPAPNKKHEEKSKKISRRDFLKRSGDMLKGAAVTATAYEVDKHTGFFEKAKDGIGDAFSRILKRKEEKQTELKTEMGFDSEEILNETELGLQESRENPQRSGFEIKKIADHYLKAFETLKLKEDFFPHKIFTRDLLIAQQMQESRFEKDAKSKSGAIGVMQNMDISIADVSLFLEKLNDDGVVEYNGPIYIGNLTKEKNILENRLKKLDNKQDKGRANSIKRRIAQIEQIIKKKEEKYKDRLLKDSDLVALEIQRVDRPDYSRALGKLYLMRLSNEKYGYSAGLKEREKGDVKGAQTEILGAYNAGYGRIKNRPVKKWPEESQTYVKRIFNYMTRLTNIRNSISSQYLDTNQDYAAAQIGLEMDKVTTKGQKRKETLDKTMIFFIKEIKKEQALKGSELSDEELYNLFQKYKEVKNISLQNLQDLENL